MWHPQQQTPLHNTERKCDVADKNSDYQRWKRDPMKTCDDAPDVPQPKKPEQNTNTDSKAKDVNSGSADPKAR